MLLNAWLNVVTQSIHLKCQRDSFAFHLVLLPLLHEIRLSDDRIFKRLKNIDEVQPDYLNCEYSVSSLEEKKWRHSSSTACKWCYDSADCSVPSSTFKSQVSVLDSSTEGNEKIGQNWVVLLVTSTTFDNGNTKITVLICNKLNWTELDCWWKRGLSHHCTACVLFSACLLVLLVFIKYVGYLIISAFWKEVKKEMIGASVPQTDEPIIRNSFKF